MTRRGVLLWAVILATLVALGVPWFLWRDSAVAFGLPVWLWWHVGWMVLAAFVFRTFARRAWGVGIETEPAEPRGDRA